MGNVPALHDFPASAAVHRSIGVAIGVEETNVRRETRMTGRENCILSGGGEALTEEDC
jgi:hypothetical protein